MIDESNVKRGSDYLWDRSGPVDAQIAQMERSLEVFRYDEPPKTLQFASARRASAASGTWWRAAALLALAIGGTWIAAALLHHPDKKRPATAWAVTTLQGSPMIGSQTVARDGKLGVGQWLNTDASSQAEIAVASIGRVTVSPDSRLRLVESAAHQHRLELAQGRIEAFITAPPRLFLVDTPAATAIDLGCKYDLAVGKDGSGMLEVTLGWVALERDGQEVIVPFGAQCRMIAGVGPGTPHYPDSSERLQQALQRFDSGDAMDDSLLVILEEAGRRDSLTLWHLISRVERPQRQHVIDRLLILSPLPSNVSRRDIVDGRVEAMMKWRDAFAWSPPSAATISR